MGKGKAWGKAERFMIPTLPICMAVFCCVLNFIIPGLGTMVAAFASLCCNHNRDMKGIEKCCSCFVNILFGFLQLILVILMFMGWIWSAFWGVSMVVLSLEYYHKDQTPAVAPTPIATTYVSQTVTTTHFPGQPGYVVHPGPRPEPVGGYAPIGYAPVGYAQPGVVYVAPHPGGVAPQPGAVEPTSPPPAYPVLQESAQPITKENSGQSA